MENDSQHNDPKPKIRRLRFRTRVAVRDADEEHKEGLKRMNERNAKFWESRKERK